MADKGTFRLDTTTHFDSCKDSTKPGTHENILLSISWGRLLQPAVSTVANNHHILISIIVAHLEMIDVPSV